MNVFPQGYFGKPVSSEDEHASIFASLTAYKKRYFVQFIKALPHNAHVLDVGCGKGKTIRLIRELRPDVVIDGCDVSDVKSFLPEGVTFTQCSADEISLRFKEASFDAVICQHVIEHLTYSSALMHSIRFILKQKGEFFLETPNWTRLLVPFSPLYFWDDYTHIHPFSVTSIHRLLNEYDFDVEYVTSVSTVDIGKRLGTIFKKKESPKERTQEEDRPAKKSLAKKIFDAFLDVTVHQVLRDVIVASASRK